MSGSDLLRRASGLAAILRSLPGERRAHFLAREELRARRDRRLRELVEYAVQTVPHYRGRAGLAAIRGAADLARLPLLTKQQVQRDPERFRSESGRGRDAIPFRSSGVTGEPVTVYRDRRALLANIAHAERERDVEARLCGRRYRYPLAIISNPGGNEMQVRSFYERSSFRPLRPETHQLLMDQPVESLLASLERIRPLVVRGHGMFLDYLYRTAHETGARAHLPQVIAYGGERMPEGGRALFERLGVSVISRYSAVEAFKIGFTCERGDGFHLHEDLCHVEVVDDDGEPVEAEQPGEVVVTDLVNRGSVLLRYRLGDLGRVTEEPCACGRSTRRLLDLQGRLYELFRLRDGSVLHSAIVERRVFAFGGALRFQLVQQRLDAWQLGVVPADDASLGRLREGLVPELRELLQGAEVELVRRDELRDVRGKYRSVIALPTERQPRE